MNYGLASFAIDEILFLGFVELVSLPLIITLINRAQHGRSQWQKRQ